MKTLRSFALLALSILLISSWSGPARASLFWEFGFIGTENNFSGMGTFQLNGPTTADGLAAFEFNGVCGLDQFGAENTCEFTLSNFVVQVAQWQLEDDWTFSSFQITIAKFFNPFTGVIFLTTGGFELVCADPNPPLNVCDGAGSTRRDNDYGAGAFLRPIHDVPEPATVALFAIALGGLGFMMRRRVA